MRDFSSPPYGALSASDYASDGPLVRAILKDVLTYLGEVGPAFKRIQLGKTPDSSGDPLSPVLDHGLLSGLGDDDHSQYLLLAGRSGQTINDAITIVSPGFPNGVGLTLQSSGFKDALKVTETVTASYAEVYGHHINSYRTGWSGGFGAITAFDNTVGSVDWGISTGEVVMSGGFPVTGITGIITYDGRFVSRVFGSSNQEIALYCDTADMLSIEDGLASFGSSGRIAQLSLASISAATTRTFVFPDASGTLALTSDLAHNLLSSTHSDTTAASVVRGDLIVGQQATPKWERLAKGTSGTFLKADANDLSWANIAETDITDGSILARVAADETISGDWNYTGTPSFSGSGDSSGGSVIFNIGSGGEVPIFRTNSGASWWWGYIEDADNPGLNYMPLALDGAPTSLNPLVLPAGGGTVVTTTGAANLSSKTMTGANTYYTGNTSAFLFTMYSSTTKQMYLTFPTDYPTSTKRQWEVSNADGRLCVRVDEEIKSNQTAAITSTTLYTTAATVPKLYRISYFLLCSTANAGDTVDTLTFSNGTQSIEVIAAKHGGSFSLDPINNCVGDSITLYCGTSGNITYSTTYTGTTGAYYLHIITEQLG